MVKMLTAVWIGLDIAQVKHLKLVVVAFVQAVWVADIGAGTAVGASWRGGWRGR